MRRRLLTRLFLLIVLAFAGFVLLVWWTAPTNITSIDRCEAIRAQMTDAEATELLGAPGNDGSILESANRELENVEAIAGVGRAPSPPAMWKEWRTTEGRRIAVAFDDGGKVMTTASFDVEDTWLDKIRRWLRLSR
jgi:hypothetical protein